MNEIAHRLNKYIQNHPFDSGDSDCETVLDQLYQAYAESHERDPSEIGDGFKELEEYLHTCRWMITTQCSTSAAVCAVHTNAKPFWMVCNTVPIYCVNWNSVNNSPGGAFATVRADLFCIGTINVLSFRHEGANN